MATTKRQLAAEAAELAHPVFVTQGWQYGMADETRVPSEGHLAIAVSDLLAGVDGTTDGCLQARSGRFRVVLDVDDEGLPEGIHVLLELGHIKF